MCGRPERIRLRRRRRRRARGFLYKLLSVFLICGCLVAAITLFFRVDTVVITGEKRYAEAEIRQAQRRGGRVTTSFC